MFTRIVVLDILGIIFISLDLLTGLLPSEFGLMSTILAAVNFMIAIYLFKMDLNYPNAVSDKLRKNKQQ